MVSLSIQILFHIKFPFFSSINSIIPISIINNEVIVADLLEKSDYLFEEKKNIQIKRNHNITSFEDKKILLILLIY